jgi:hypothetical protein
MQVFLLFEGAQKSLHNIFLAVQWYDSCRLCVIHLRGHALRILLPGQINVIWPRRPESNSDPHCLAVGTDEWTQNQGTGEAISFRFRSLERGVRGVSGAFVLEVKDKRQPQSGTGERINLGHSMRKGCGSGAGDVADCVGLGP